MFRSLFLISPAEQAYERSVIEARQLRLALIFVLLIVVGLGIDSVQFCKTYFDGRQVANILFISYFCLMYYAVDKTLQRFMFVMVPLSYLGELLCSDVLGMYAYKGDAIPIYVPFGHALVFATGYVFAKTNFIQKRERQLKILFPVIFLLLFVGAWLFFDDVFSILFGVLFFLVMKRKRGNIMYYCLGFCALFVEFIGTPFGCWKWVPDIFNFLPAANPPVGTVFIYVGGDVILSKILFLWDKRNKTN